MFYACIKLSIQHIRCLSSYLTVIIIRPIHLSLSMVACQRLRENYLE